ncbi:MAG: hypothetical protein M0C28_46965 [Candidatus Moduliflexus flocculans]|nr:hypothetical protein [Candidatus Moduliflexus flocculans]
MSTLGDTTVGVLTRTVFIPKIGQVKPVAAKVNAMYKAKTGNDLSGASARSFTGLQAWVHVLEKAGSAQTGRHPEGRQRHRDPRRRAGGALAGHQVRHHRARTSARTPWASGLIGQYQKDGRRQDRSGNRLPLQRRHGQHDLPLPEVLAGSLSAHPLAHPSEPVSEGWARAAVVRRGLPWTSCSGPSRPASCWAWFCPWSRWA